MVLNRWARWGREAYQRYTAATFAHLANRDSAFPHYAAQLASVFSDGDRILHVGCGWDRSEATKQYAGRGTVVGVDLDEEAVQRYHSEAWLADIASLPFCDASFDGACSEYVFEHLAEPDTAMQEMARVIRPGGYLVAVTPSRWSYKSIAAALTPHAFHEWAASSLRRDTRSAEDVYETHYLMNTPAMLRRLADRWGFEVDSIQVVSNGPTWFPRIIGLFELGRLYHALIERSDALENLRCTIVVRFTRTGTAEKNARADGYIRCPKCRKACGSGGECGECSASYPTAGKAFDARTT